MICVKRFYSYHLNDFNGSRQTRSESFLDIPGSCRQPHHNIITSDNMHQVSFKIPLLVSLIYGINFKEAVKLNICTVLVSEILSTAPVVETDTRTLAFTNWQMEHMLLLQWSLELEQSAN